jgi:hypothetical protein
MERENSGIRSVFLKEKTFARKEKEIFMVHVRKNRMQALGPYT